MTEKKNTWGSTGRGPVSSEKPDSKRETRRKDWGYTDQYRRMMQRDSRRKENLKAEEEL